MASVLTTTGLFCAPRGLFVSSRGFAQQHGSCICSSRLSSACLDYRGMRCTLLRAHRDDKGRMREDGRDKTLQVVLWGVTGVYVVWLFLLPVAPGDPVWRIQPETISMLLDLSLNFFYVLPLANVVGFHFVEAPVIHPVAEALFNFVIGWTVMFGPLLFSDCRRNRFKGSLELLWLGQLFLTNTFLLPYMAIRLNSQRADTTTAKPEKSFLDAISSVMLSGSSAVAIVGGLVGVTSLAWAAFGRPGFGDINQRSDYFVTYISTDRVAYAFVWDLCLYSVLQPWLILSNIRNIRRANQVVKALSFFPFFGLVAYLWGLSWSTRDRE